MDVTIIADKGTHLLIADGSRYAVIERRDGNFYNCHGDSREGVLVDSLSDIGKVLDTSDWADKEPAQATSMRSPRAGNSLPRQCDDDNALTGKL
jgi:hypothetical protein